MTFPFVCVVFVLLLLLCVGVRPKGHEVIPLEKSPGAVFAFMHLLLILQLWGAQRNLRRCADFPRWGLINQTLTKTFILLLLLHLCVGPRPEGHEVIPLGDPCGKITRRSVRAVLPWVYFAGSCHSEPPAKYRPLRVGRSTSGF